MGTNASDIKTRVTAQLQIVSEDLIQVCCIPDYSDRHGRYWVTRDGRVLSVGKDHIKELSCNRVQPGGYGIVLLAGRGGPLKEIQRSRLVCAAFNGPCPSSEHECDHIDGNIRNDAAANLRWLHHSDHHHFGNPAWKPTAQDDAVAAWLDYEWRLSGDRSLLPFKVCEAFVDENGRTPMKRSRTRMVRRVRGRMPEGIVRSVGPDRRLENLREAECWFADEPAPTDSPTVLEVAEALEAEGQKDAAVPLRDALAEAAGETEAEAERKRRVADAVERLANRSRCQRPSKEQRRAGLLRATEDVRHIRLNSRELRGHEAGEKSKAWMTALFADSAQHQGEQRP